MTLDVYGVRVIVKTVSQHHLTFVIVIIYRHLTIIIIAVHDQHVTFINIVTELSRIVKGIKYSSEERTALYRYYISLDIIAPYQNIQILNSLRSEVKKKTIVISKRNADLHESAGMS